MSNDDRGATKFNVRELLLVCSFPFVAVLLVLNAPAMIPPALLFFGVFLVFTRTRFGPRHFKGAIALSCCHMAAFFFVAIVGSADADTQPLVSLIIWDLVLLAVCVTGLVLWPGAVTALLLGAYELAALGANLLRLVGRQLGSSTDYAWLLGHIGVRALTLASLVTGYWAWSEPVALARSKKLTPQRPVEAAPSPDTEVKLSRQPAPKRSAEASLSAKKKRLWSAGVVVAVVVAAACFALIPASLASECSGPSSSLARDRCLNDLAVRTGAIGLCRSMAADRIEDCIVEVVTQATGEAADCKSLASEKRAECITRLVRLGRPAELCAQTLGTASGKKCAFEAGKLGGADACQRLPNELRAACVEASVPQIDDAVGTCARGRWCPSLVGTRELSGCAAKRDIDEVSDCFVSVFIKQQGWARDSLCDSVDEGLRDRCLMALALRGDHGATCSKVRDPARRRSCVSIVARADASYCRLLDSETERLGCLTNAGLNTLDAEHCSRVEGKQLQQCVETSRSRVQPEPSRLAQ